MKRVVFLALALLVLAGPASAMQRRQQNVVDTSGRPVAGATVTVYLTGTQTKATIYSDNGITVIGNPITVNSTDGSYTYYAANGRYDEVISATGVTFTAAQTKDLLFDDPADASSGVVTSVPGGGTGVSTFTANGVLYGNGAGPLRVTAQGPANSVLAANAGVPSFSATPTLTSLTTTSSVSPTLLNGVYTLGGTPTLGAALALNGQTLSGNATLTGTLTGGTFASPSITGTLTLGTSFTSGSSTNDFIMANGAWLRFDQAANPTFKVLSRNGSTGAINLGDSSSIIALGLSASNTVTGATTGDTVIQNSQTHRAVNFANTSAKRLIGLNTSDRVSIDADALGTVFGGRVLVNTGVATGAGTGSLILANGAQLKWVKADASTTLEALRYDTSNVLVVGGESGTIVSIGSPVATGGATTSDLIVGAGVRFVDNAGTNTLSGIRRMASADVIQVGASVIVAVGTPGAVSGANNGDLVLANGTDVKFSNAAGSSTVRALTVDSGNKVALIGGAAGVYFVATATGAPKFVLGLTLGDTTAVTDPTGGDKGRGTVNVLNGYYLNGTLISTVTMKSGSGAGDYTTTSATYADVDGTNLAYTVTVPTGFKVLANASMSLKNSSLGAAVGVALADGTTTLTEVMLDEAVAGDREGVSLTYAFTGDGASHTFKLRWKTSAGTNTMDNSTSTLTPRMTFLMVPSS